ncbi:MAG: nucleotidyltransferase domain-containing protein [Oscillospiraceae bacterium]|nr:nucleotidyltransferase domain-containing protein [Oscillospiraceae bacterium]
MSDIQMLQRLVRPIALRHGVERVYLFGSRARGEARSDSDYDFLISKGKVTSLLRMASFWSDMEDALHAPVDVVTDTSNDAALIAEARKDGILIYEQA